jgi:hypothetical protein
MRGPGRLAARQAGERTDHFAVAVIRTVIDELREDVTETLIDGTAVGCASIMATRSNPRRR